MKKIFSIILASLAMVSCVDTIILPEDKTVEEDFWKTKSQVEAMVNGAYAAMASENVQTRIIMWSCRSDELNVNTSLSNSTLNQFNSGNLQTDNTYNSWSQFYYVINNCNLVISKSAEVMDIDPNYLEGDHQNNVAQMKALRSLAYFYLVRAFRDVPLILEPYKESSQEMNVPQQPAGVVMDQIISDLEEVQNKALDTQGQRGSNRMGYFTRDGIRALLADCYLWRASITRSAADYEKCVAYCNMIRDARANDSSKGFGGGFGMRPGSSSNFDDDGFNLASVRNNVSRFYNPFEGTGNDDESIFELEFTTNNPGLEYCYYKLKDNSSSQPYFFTNTVYAVPSKDADHVFNEYTADVNTDVRGFESVFNFNAAGDDGVLIRKYVATEGIGTTKAEASFARDFKTFDTNWIIYRASDVMLMKAEAMVQLAKLKAAENAGIESELAACHTISDSVSVASKYEKACQDIAALNVTGVRQAQIVNTRAQTDEVSMIDSTKYAVDVKTLNAESTDADKKAYVTSVSSYVMNAGKLADELEILIMNERARELCFEGKRWFDMLRYNYRHTAKPVDYYTSMVDLGEQMTNYDEMLKLIARKYTSGGVSGQAVVANMKTEPYLYMPILKSEIEVNSMLRQNPVYKNSSTSEKNY